jgi:hypothetical protein
MKGSQFDSRAEFIFEVKDRLLPHERLEVPGSEPASRGEHGDEHCQGGGRP